jgi:hypothetical protein
MSTVLAAFEFGYSTRDISFSVYGRMEWMDGFIAVSAGDSVPGVTMSIELRNRVE